jgi:predicted phage tail protein
MYPFSSDRSISQLLGEALGELSKLIQTEFAIARIEMSEKLASIAGAGKLIGAGAAIALASLVVILMAIAAALMRAGLPDWAADLCTGGVAAIVGVGLILAGLSRLSSRSLTPSTTLDELQRDRLAAKALTQ